MVSPQPDEPDEPGSLPVPLADEDLPAWWGPVLDSSVRDREQLGGGEVDLDEIADVLGSDPDVLREFVGTHSPRRRYLVAESLSVTIWAGVYVAIDMARGRPIVLKISRRTVESEGSLIATINHPNVVTVHDVFAFAGHPTTVLEWCRQGTLQSQVGRADWRDLLARALEAGRGLAYLHSHGLVHADVKPSNILLSHKTGKIGDLGLAGPETLHGPTWGTPTYCPPEREHGVFTRAGDVYSLALTIVFVLRKHDDVPESIMRVLDGALVTDHESRPPLVRLLADLQRELDAERARPEIERRLAARELEHRRRRSWLQTAVVLAALVSGGGTMAIAGVCSEPASTVELNLDLAVRAAERGDGLAAVQNLELAMRQAKLDDDHAALREVASVAESLGHRLIAAGERAPAHRSWFVARECFSLVGDKDGEARVTALYTEHSSPRR